MTCNPKPDSLYFKSYIRPVVKGIEVRMEGFSGLELRPDIQWVH